MLAFCVQFVREHNLVCATHIVLGMPALVVARAWHFGPACGRSRSAQMHAGLRAHCALACAAATCCCMLLSLAQHRCARPVTRCVRGGLIFKRGSAQHWLLASRRLCFGAPPHFGAQLGTCEARALFALAACGCGCQPTSCHITRMHCAAAIAAAACLRLVEPPARSSHTCSAVASGTASESSVSCALFRLHAQADPSGTGELFAWRALLARGLSLRWGACCDRGRLGLVAWVRVVPVTCLMRC